MRPQGGPHRVYTVGHSNHALEHFLGLLTGHDVELVVDVRSHPVSRFHHFDRARLEPSLAAAGIGYCFLGQAVGGRPPDPAFREPDGSVRYDALAASPAFREGVARIAEASASRRVALLCGEEDPRDCHRRFLVGRALQAQGIEVVHIRGDGRLELEEEVARRGSGAS